MAREDGALVMNQERVYTYDDSVNTFYFVADAVLGFKLIKSQFIHKDSTRKANNNGK